jgi:hypothetical protein
VAELARRVLGFSPIVAEEELTGVSSLASEELNAPEKARCTFPLAGKDALGDPGWD